MNLRSRLFLFIPAMLLIWSSCGKDDPIPETPVATTGTLEIHFHPTMNGVAYQPNTLFTGPNGKRMNMELFRFYLSDLVLRNGSDTAQVKEIALVDMNSEDGRKITASIKPGTYQGLDFFVGVKPSLNGTNDPNFNEAQFPSDHPLSIYNNMYWSWATGYIFSKLEGKIDTSAAQNANPTYTWFYHSGMDTCYTAKQITGLNLNIEKGKTTVLELQLEANAIFTQNGDTINMVQDYFTHTTDNLPLALKVIRNLSQAIHP